ncbi:lytic murein transglycosylase [Altererythrobacter atlanticus]|uniref:Membrane-bound lytic murein transglycosylase B n=1 Tax=Croceibacterium atlanticum TaxID=1267766 RepID=A0A0F7KPW6_9SPHN|nr:lytic murein transglycosylase [Croceibacterium atlanticum]AKH41599.1 Membrane-bound lytic murein transglycosylase B precursor [Croceibacterium atlanticum]MBB5733061.1 lytic murein transglycosylase [Croceibacterium atlanticum]
MLAKTLRFLAISVAALTAGAPANAQDLPFDSYIQLVAAKARGQGVSQATIDRLLSDLTPNQRVLALDRDNISSGGSSSGYPAMAPYLNRHNTAARIRRGQHLYSELGSLARDVERQYGVPPEILLAIWGHETSYGAIQGSFDLARSLATLAWEGRRRSLFEAELIDLLRIAEEEQYPRSKLVGSWAGAFGNSQFLPSVFLRLAVDGDGDGHRDIWNSEVDTLHSIANYFRDAGWRRGEPWGVRAYTPNSVDRMAIAPKVVAPVCPRVHERHSRWMTVAEWKKLGVMPQEPIGDDVMASLFEPDGPAAPSYLLTQNYRVILEYNCSNYYAMSVGLLADEIIR